MVIAFHVAQFGARIRCLGYAGFDALHGLHHLGGLGLALACEREEFAAVGAIGGTHFLRGLVVSGLIAAIRPERWRIWTPSSPKIFFVS